MKNPKTFLSIFFVSLLVAGPLATFAQILKPATWSFNAAQTQVKVGEEVDLVFTVDIDSGWYVYSTDFDPDLGPMLTEFTFEPGKNYELVGEIKPIGAKEKYDELWEGNIRYFTKKAEFRQTIKVTGADLKQITGAYGYQVCDDARCIPFNDEFAFNLNVLATNIPASKATETPVKETPEKTPTAKAEEKTVKESPEQPAAEALEEKATTAETNASANEEEKKVKADAPVVTKNEAETTDTAPAKKKVSETATVSAGTLNANSPYSLLGFFLVAFLAGLAALLTPCVFPMIPMTVSFFSSTSNNRGQAVTKALTYGISIIVIYTIVGTVVSAIFGPAFANWLSTHWLPNIFFFAVFVIFALSFFGLFEITLPSSMVNNVDKQADKGGFTGVFFMAFTLVLVSFSCTGPIVGSILVEAAGGEFVQPILGMLGFSLAFAIPFTIFAIFPEWLNSLPKSGGWLNSVKVVLGFLELALALKFLSVADQVYHWNILDREVYLTLWIVIFTLMGFYLLGKIRLPHDSPLESVSVSRLMLSIVTFSFVVYLIPGLFGAPLKALAGYLPPMHTHDFDVPTLIAQKMQTSNGFLADNQEEELCETPKYADLLHIPHGIKGYFDYEQALACAEEQNKPVFLDFTGHGCVNCREMEARVWSEPEVLERLKKDFIVVSLYVDEKTTLPETEWYVSEYDGKTKKTIGNQNADLQITRFNNNAQPYYVILSPNGDLLAEPKAYDLNVQNFVDFLDTAKDRFANGETVEISTLAGK